MTVERWMARMMALAATLILAGPVDLRSADASEPYSVAEIHVSAAFDLEPASEAPAQSRCRQGLPWGYDACLSDTWQVTAEALFLHRRRPDAADLVIDAIDQSSILNAHTFDLGVHPGFDVSLTRRFGAFCAVEARYFGIDHWQAATAVPTTPGDLQQWNALHPVFVWAGTGISASHSSELHNVEVNGKYRWSDCWTLLAGFRYAELDERFAADLIDPDVPFSFRTATRNRLYGGQLGAHVVLWDGGGRFTVDAFGKAGIFGKSPPPHP